MAIVVVGSINLDLVTTVDSFPASGATIAGRGFAMHAGGKGANQAVAAARLGTEVRMIGMLGEDAFAAVLRDGLEREGIDHRGVGTVAGSSGIAAITVDGDGQNMIVIAPGANQAVTPAYLAGQAALLEGAEMVLAQLEIPIETVVLLARLCAERQIPLMLDPAPAQTLPESLLREIAWFTPNETEARFYLGDNAADPAAALLGRGCRGVILKQGAQGALLAKGDLRRQGRPPAVPTVDTTAAGDTFNGAFAAELVRGSSPDIALHYAIAAAALSVTRQGAQPSMPTRAEVNQLLQEQG